MSSDDIVANLWNEDAFRQNDELLSEKEIEIREKFVEYYLQTYSAKKAVICLGYIASFVDQMASSFMQCPYVQKRIYEKEIEPLGDDFTEEDLLKREVLMGLRRESKSCLTDSARVSALSKMATVLGMDKRDVNVNHGGGVMLVPGTASIDEWEEEALNSQEDLVKDARSDIED